MAMTGGPDRARAASAGAHAQSHELGITLKEHAARIGLDVQHLYQLRKAAGAQGCARAGPRAAARR